MDSYLGTDEYQIITQWGPADRTEPDGHGGKILIYGQRVYANYNTLNTTVDYWEYKMFYLNRDNIVYHWLIKRSPNAPERIDVRILSN